MTKQELAQKLVDIYVNSGTIVTASLGIFTFIYGEYAVDVYTPTELIEAAHAINSNVKIRYSAELNAAFAMFRYFKNNPALFSIRKEVFANLKKAKKEMPWQLITYGAPGTGKSWEVKQETQGRSCIRTTFHPDSDYSTFVGTYKPTMEETPRTALVGKKIELAEGSSELLKEKRIVYRFVAQAFLEAYVEAWRKCSGFLSAQDENGRAANVQFLVIEEINRGNCAQVFGDIFQLLDREDDGYSSYAIQADSDLRQYLEEAFQSLDLANVDLGDRDVTPEEIKSGEKMLLPPNLLIRATMNTSDQSLFPMDSAFKRRWDWKYVPIRNHPEEDYRIEIGGETYRWWPFITEINKRILSATESEDKKLGYFFVKAEKGSDGRNVIDADKFLNKVVFYLWNDVFKNSEPEKAFKFERPDGKKDIAAFQDFFKEEDGSRDDGMLKAFLKGLGVEAVAEDAQENAAGGPASPVEESPAPAALPPGTAE